MQPCLFAVGTLLAGCVGAQIRDGVYINAAKGFALQLPAGGWKAEIGTEPDLFLRHGTRGAGIVIHATCDEVPRGRPLEIVARHLLFGIRGKEILRQGRRATASEEAVETVLRGEVEDRGFLVHSVTLRGCGCVYDLVLFAPPEVYAETDGDFEALVAQFHLLREGKR